MYGRDRYLSHRKHIWRVQFGCMSQDRCLLHKPRECDAFPTLKTEHEGDEMAEMVSDNSLTEATEFEVQAKRNTFVILFA